MGFLDVFKKKQPAQAMPQDFNLNQIPTDLPSIDGNNLNLPPLDDKNLPPLNEPAIPNFNLPNSLPLDDSNNNDSNNILTDNSDLPGLPPLSFASEQEDKMGEDNEQPTQLTSFTPEDINKLFLADETWKEPDWVNFDPYHEDLEELPKPEDFIDVSQMSLPSLDNEEENILPEKIQNNSVQNESNEESQSAEEFLGAKRMKSAPMELFVKGTDYKQVFIDLNAISETLTSQESKLNIIQELNKQQEPLMNTAKDELEFVQKKLMYIDKKLFT